MEIKLNHNEVVDIILAHVRANVKEFEGKELTALNEHYDTSDWTITASDEVSQ